MTKTTADSGHIECRRKVHGEQRTKYHWPSRCLCGLTDLERQRLSCVDPQAHDMHDVPRNNSTNDHDELQMRTAHLYSANIATLFFPRSAGPLTTLL